MEKKLPQWKNMKYGDRIFVEKLVAEYTLNSTAVFPYTKCKVRIWYDSERNYYFAHSNIGIRDIENNTVDRIAGSGATEEDALNDQIKYLLEMILQYETKWGRKLTDEDYEYLDPDDF